MPRLIASLLLFMLLVPLLACGGDDGSDSPTEKLVFVSSLTYSGDLAGVDAAHDECQALADAAGLGGTYMAWLSDATGSPSLDFSDHALPYELVDGTLVANDWDDLTDGVLENPIDLDEYGAPAPPSDKMCGSSTSWVMTGTYESGNWAGAGSDCTAWTSNTGGGSWGRTDSVVNWSFACSGGANRDRCANSAPIFCFEQ